jgi:ubiquinone/menaquinone biosynthesis C-methylase UbiE
MSEVRERLEAARREGGVGYSALYLMRGAIDRVRDGLDRRLAAIEQQKGLVAPWTISAKRFTAADNRTLWNMYDWSSAGEEWTRSSEWKQGIIDDLLRPNIPEGSVVLEVGPGGGRWTEILQRRARSLFVVDVAEKPLALCRDRFRACSNIEYLLSDGRTLAVPDNSIDVVWSYDVFVHINPMDARGYFQEFNRVLKPGGRAVVHHPGAPLSADRERRWRSDLTEPMVLAFCRENGFCLLSQTRQYVNEGDVLSLIQKLA